MVNGSVVTATSATFSVWTTFTLTIVSESENERHAIRSHTWPDFTSNNIVIVDSREAAKFL
jgi:hypothetical protein